MKTKTIKPEDEVTKLRRLMAEMDQMRKAMTDPKLAESIKKNDAIWNARR